MLDQITPLILTYNEGANIGRALESLSWARDIVVVDSFSNDETLEIVSTFPRVRVFQRVFDCHRNQWEFGLRETGIATTWVLALDADYLPTNELLTELKLLRPDDDTLGYCARFVYCINGRRLRSGIYPPVTVLYRREAATYIQDGHTQRVSLEGRVEPLQSPMLHDDHKSLSRWFQSQTRYTALEARKLLAADRAELSFTDRMRRRWLVVPPAALIYCLIVRGGVLDGWPGLYYAFQRTLAEIMLSLYLIENAFGRRRSDPLRRASSSIGNEQTESRN